MRILGVDFTSRPSRKKPITACWATRSGSVLRVDSLVELPDWDSFEALLQTPGPWVGGFDLPLGQPAAFLDSLGWTGSYVDVVTAVSRLSLSEWVETCRAYHGPNGERELRRRTDVAARATSPMKCFFTPVARMFQAGAPRLVAAGLSMPMHGVVGDHRIAYEVYPALVAQALAGTRSYKTDIPAKVRPEHRPVRERLVAALGEPNIYRVTVVGLPPDLVEDAGADRLDAVLAALAAASGAPFPAGVDVREGWIIDPATAGG